MGEVIEFRPDAGRKVIIPTKPARPYTDIEKALQPFLDSLDNVENFVVLYHTKKGDLNIIPFLDTDINVWSFIEAFKTRSNEATITRLIGDQNKPIIA